MPRKNEERELMEDAIVGTCDRVSEYIKDYYGKALVWTVMRMSYELGKYDAIHGREDWSDGID